MKIAAMGDIHVGPKVPDTVKRAFELVPQHAEVLFLAGDLTNHGTPQEIAVCLELIQGIQIPVVAVLGNHDYESGLEEEFSRKLLDSGIHVLDGNTYELNGIGFAGTKGFCGGFIPHQLMSFGEQAIKDLVEASRSEAEKLYHAVAALKTTRRIALLHYAPIQATVRGEPEAILPFLGSSHLEEVIDRTRPDLVLHGHAHHGCFEGHTRGGIRVCNVAMPVLYSQCELPFAIFDLNAPAIQG
jgi:Icc-related predicted phosphoesterase